MVASNRFYAYTALIFCKSSTRRKKKSLVWCTYAAYHQPRHIQCRQPEVYRENRADALQTGLLSNLLRTYFYACVALLYSFNYSVRDKIICGTKIRIDNRNPYSIEFFYTRPSADFPCRHRDYVNSQSQCITSFRPRALAIQQPLPPPREHRQKNRSLSTYMRAHPRARR